MSGHRASSGSRRPIRPRPRSPSTSAPCSPSLAFAWGLGRALSRRESALPSALLAATLLYLASLALGTPYTQAKALAIAAPLIMVIALRGLLSADPLPGEEPTRGAHPGSGNGGAPRPVVSRRRAAAPIAGIGGAAADDRFAAAAAFSTLLPLRQAAVGPDYHLQEMLRIRPIVDGQNVLFLGRDNFVSWELIGSEVYAPITNHYDVEETHSLYRATDLNAKFDWDNVPQFVMNKFNWVVTTSAAMQSQAPPGFAPRLRTGDFILWHRDHPVGQRRTLLRAAQSRGSARLRRPRAGPDPGRRHGDGLHGPACDRQGLEPEPGADPDEAGSYAPLPDSGPLGALDPVRQHPAAAPQRERAGLGSPFSATCAPTCSSAGPRPTTRRAHWTSRGPGPCS